MTYPVASQASPYHDAAKQVGFIVGTGRCGTTILARILNSHSAIVVPPELQILVSNGVWNGLYETFLAMHMQRFDSDAFIAFIMQRCPYHLERFFDYEKHFHDLTYPQQSVRAVYKSLADGMCHAYGKGVFLEQTPWYGQKLDEIHGIFPKAKIIHIIRDGRDVAISFARTPWWSKDAGKNLQRWEQEVQGIHAFCQQHPEICLEITYESLVMGPVETLSKIFELLGLSFEPAMLDAHRLIDYRSMSRRAQSRHLSSEFEKWSRKKKDVFFTGRVFAWKRNRDLDLRALTQQAAPTLKLFGYETGWESTSTTTPETHTPDSG